MLGAMSAKGWSLRRDEKKTRDNLIADSRARDTCSLFIWSKSNGVRVLNVADAALAYFLLRTNKNESVTQLVDTHSMFH